MLNNSFLTIPSSVGSSPARVTNIKDKKMIRKYELTAVNRQIGQTGDEILYQIRALYDFSDVKAGDLGGFIRGEENLSHNDLCWVYDNAWISGYLFFW